MTDITTNISPNPMPFLHPARVLCTWFGVGLVPFASGTVASLVALPIGYFLQQHFGAQGLLCCATALFFLGWWASTEYLRLSPDKENTDPKEIVVDEVVGQWLLLSALPVTLQSYAAAFILFRFFDIVKPWPVSAVDSKIKTGLGVMLDDVLAGFYPVFLTMLAYALCFAFGKQDLIFSWLFWLNGHHG